MAPCEDRESRPVLSYWRRLHVSKLVLTLALGTAIVPMVANITAAGTTAAPAPSVDTIVPLAPTMVSYKDGSFTGPAVDAYWGQLQVQALVQNGQIGRLSILRYPSD